MATNMFPSLNPAPLGLDALAPEMDEGPEIEVQIENPDGVLVGMDGIEIDLMEIVAGDKSDDFDANLAEEMDEGELQKVASDLVEMVDSDISGRKEWVEMYVKGLDVLGMKYEERTEPWLGACGVFSTVLTEAAVRFQSETIIETFPAQGPVKTEIIGAIDRLKEEAAERVREDMNYQLTEVMSEYRPEHEKMLYSLGLAGSAFKKVYYDPGLARQIAVFIPAEDIIIPYGASSLKTSDRVTHIMRKTKNDMKKLQVAGFYRDVELGEPQIIHTDIEKKKAEDQGFSLTEDDRYQILEIHVDYDLPGYEDEDEIALPYVVTIDRGTNKVLAIRRNWNPEDKRKLKRDHFVQYTYIPGFGAYGLGLIHLIGGYARAGTSIIRQLVDAGTLANLPGGLKARGLRIKGDDTPINPGEFRDVEDESTGEVETKTSWFQRYYRVFNGSQIEGLSAFEKPEVEVDGFDHEDEGYPEADLIGTEWCDTLSGGLHHGSDRAYYTPSMDSITMPEPEQFKTLAAYYQTLFHEIAHSTGHVSRADRLEKGGFGTDTYAKEELVAEFAAAFLCANTEVPLDESQSAAYLKGWAAKCKDEPKLLYSAANAAQYAASMVMENTYAAVA